MFSTPRLHRQDLAYTVDEIVFWSSTTTTREARCSEFQSAEIKSVYLEVSVKRPSIEVYSLLSGCDVPFSFAVPHRQSKHPNTNRTREDEV